MLVMRYIRDFPEVEAQREERPSMSQYTTLLKEGVSYLWHTPFVKWLLIGSMVTTSTITVWGNLILFPLYFSYLITDVAVASYRTIAFIPGVAANERSGIWSQKFEPKKWIPRFRLLQACGFVFYIILAFMMHFFPPVGDAAIMATVYLPFTSIVLIELPIQHIAPIMILFSLFTVTMFFGGFAEILTQREILDAIPNRNRNSLYSLQPTVLLMLSTPQIVIFGWLIPIIGFPITLLCCALISLAGVLIIRYALTLEKPVVAVETPQDETIGMTNEKDDTSEADVLLEELADEVTQAVLSPE
jgi:hypothetical protein